jgi:glycine dehydrogenase subunit 1
MATVYLATVGPRGLREVCEQNILNTDYAVSQIQSRTKHRILFPAARFNEFVVQLNRTDRRARGFPLSKHYPELSNATLLCVTETARREHIDAMVKELEP